MRYVVIPKSISVFHPKTKEPLTEPDKSFIDFAHDVWFNDPRAAETGPVKLRRWMRVVEKFEKYCKPGDVVTLEDEDWRFLKTIVENPKIHYSPLVEGQLESFPFAIIDASDKEPTKHDETQPS
jgi:hypothetical protein